MTIHSHSPRYDAIVVGARCAGAATALLLARRGARVLLIERDRPGTDTMSTHALMRGAVMQLDRWGVLDKIIDAQTPRVSRTTFFYGEEAIALDVKHSHGVDALYAPRRTVLDAALVEEARTAGVEVRYETAFVDVKRSVAGDVSGAVLQSSTGKRYSVTADLVVGADGRRSRVARAVEAKIEAQAPVRSACVYAYFSDMKADGYRWYFNNGSTAGAIPTNDNAHCVFASLPVGDFARRKRKSDPLSMLRAICAETNGALGEEIASARAVTRPVLFAGAGGHMRRAWGRGWALVGDAGYFKDPATAHGITDALRDAELLANVALTGGESALAQYQATRDALSHDLFKVTNEIAALDWDLPQVQALHMRLNKAMKHEQDWMFDAFAEQARAA